MANVIALSWWILWCSLKLIVEVLPGWPWMVELVLFLSSRNEKCNQRYRLRIFKLRTSLKAVWMIHLPTAVGSPRPLSSWAPSRWKTWNFHLVPLPSFLLWFLLYLDLKRKQRRWSFEMAEKMEVIWTLCLHIFVMWASQLLSGQAGILCRT